jgi:4-amino-4-deoxy-L-arabinose transferase-like glycosyltransferase
MPLNPITRRDGWWLLFILVIAAVLRLDNIGVSEYHYDHATLSHLAQETLDTRTIATLGMITSVGIPNPPTSVYVAALAYWMSDNPLFVTGFLAALNIIGVGLLWLIAHRYFNPTAAVIAGLVYAVNPWAVFYSRGIWAQDFLTPFMLLGFWLSLYGFIEGKRVAQVLALPVLIFGAQIHYAACTLLPVYIWLMWIGRKRIMWKALLVSAVLCVILVIPFLSGFMQWRSLPDNAKTVGVVFGARRVSIHNQTLIFPAWLTTGLGIENVVAPEQMTELLSKIITPAPLWLLMGGAAMLGLVILWRQYQQHRLFVTLWIALPIVAFLPTYAPVYPHYFIAIIPALALLSGLGITGLMEWRLPVSRIFVGGIFGAILISQAMWWRGLTHYLNTTSTPPGWPSSVGFSTPLGYLMDIRSRLIGYSDVLLFNSVPNQSDSTFWSPLVHSHVNCLREVVSAEGGIAIFPRHPFAALTAPGNYGYPVANLYSNDSPTLFPLRPGEGEYRLYIFNQAPVWSGPAIVPISPARFDTGVTLTGYALDKRRIYLEWMVDHKGEADQYFYTVNFVKADGSRVSQRDSNFWPTKYWCNGDRIIQWIDFDVPQASQMRVGLYQVKEGNFINSQALDAKSNTVREWTEIALKP